MISTRTGCIRYGTCLLFICDLRYNKLHIFKAYDLISLNICTYLWHYHHNQGTESFHHPPKVLLPYAVHSSLHHGPQKVSCLLLQITLHGLKYNALSLTFCLIHLFCCFSLPFFLDFLVTLILFNTFPSDYNIHAYYSESS